MSGKGCMVPDRERGDKMEIRFLTHTVTSSRDRDGNCYSYAIITSTKTGRTLTIKDYGENARGMVRDALDYLDGVWSSKEVVGKRRWNEKVKAHEEFGHFEHEVTSAMILALEENK